MSMIDPLLKLQEIDGRIRKSRQEQIDIPERKKEEEARLEAALAVCAEANAALANAQRRVEEIKAAITERQNKTLALKKSQATLKDNSEFKAFNTQIMGLQSEIEQFEHQLLIADDDVVVPRHNAALADAKLEEERKVVDEYVNELEIRKKKADEELEKAMADRAEYEKELLGDPRNARMVTEYNLLLSRGRWPVVAKLHRSECVCDGCHLRQTASVGQQVRRGKEIVKCEMCGRILYDAE